MVGRAHGQRASTGIFSKPQKCWLIVKPEKERPAKEIFSETTINITTEGRKHLGAALGSREFFAEYVDEKVEELVAQVIVREQMS